MKEKLSKISIITVFLILCRFIINAQDINFLQSFYFKEFINPSFVAQNNCNYLSANDSQTAFEYGGINTILAGFSGFYPRAKSGIVFLLKNEFHPDHIINQFSGKLAYVYKIKISRNFQLIPSLAANYNQQNINSGNIVFPSMVQELGVNNNIDYTSLPERNSRFSGLDASMLLSFNNFYLGIMASNIVTYNFSNLNSSKNAKNWILSLGYNFYSKRRKTLAALLFVQKYAYMTKANLSFIWFATDNISLSTSIQNYQLHNTAFSVSGSYRHNKLNWIVSYGINIGQLAFSIYEVGLQYEFNCKKRRQNTIICPAYQL